MKQHITEKQLNELSEKGRIRYASWCDPRDGLNWPAGRRKDGTPFKFKLPLLTIGQLIEFLREKITVTIYMDILILGVHDKQIKYTELCDALWQAVKEVLILEDKYCKCGQVKMDESKFCKDCI